MPTKANKRIDRIRRLFECKTDAELGERLGTIQPQIARWRKGDVAKTTANLIDGLLSLISKRNGEITRLKREIRELKKQLSE